MILRFNKINIHNFGSYSKAEVSLVDRGFCAVSGRNNYKKDNAYSNGSGKSMLWSAICFAITGETINGLKNNLKNINIDEDACSVTVDFNADNDHYVITRIIKPKSDLKIIRNDVDVSGKGIRESEAKLAEMLPDLTKNLIASTILIGQGMPNKFSSFSPSGRKEMLEKLTKSDFMIEDIKTRLSARQLEIQKQASAVSNSILLNNQQLNNESTELDRVNAEINGRVKIDYAGLIAASEQRIADMTKDLTEAEAEVKRLEAEIDTLNEKQLSETAAKSEACANLNKAYTEATTGLIQEKTAVEYEIRHLTAEITRIRNIKDVCPTCGQKLVGVEKPSTDDLEAKLKISNEKLVDLQNQLAAKKASLDSYSADIEASFASSLNEIRAKLAAAKNALSKAKDNVNDYSHYINTENSNLLKLKYDRDNEESKYAALEATAKKLAESLQKTRLAVETATAGKMELDEHIAVDKKMDTLVKRDFRGYLLSGIIEYIRDKAREYCETVFNTRDLDVYLDGNALEISYCGKMFDNLSGGEKQRIDLILQFAIRDLLQTYLNYSSNILVLDEIFDNLDRVATDKIISLITTKLKDIESIFIISHHADELEIPIDSELLIVKNEEGISEIF